jgi:murein L,D-transpeptidase YcbB/YkuD
MPRAAAALQLLRTAPDHGFTTAEYGEPELTLEVESLKNGDRRAADHDGRLAALDVRLTAALLMLGHDVAIGRARPTSLSQHWKARRDAPDLGGTLSEAADRDVARWLDTIRPQHTEYAGLTSALRELRRQDDQGGWPKVPPRKFAPGESNTAVMALGQRLVASGELAGPVDTSDSAVYDKKIEDAVRIFQEHHGIKPTGVPDPATVAAMNVSIADRIRQVQVNLERWRWMPDDFGSRHFLVNIPSYLLMAREDGKTVKAIRVIVGKPGHETPVFSGNMDTVVFSPYWNVPDSIAEGETAVAARRDPNYLARNQMDVLRVSKAGTKKVDPETVNWNDPDELSRLAFRQRPGAKNALGYVKFLFPNAFNVYLHDTPNDALFTRASRAFSHGCVRVEEPEALAQYVLRDRPEWDEPRIVAAMHAGVEKWVKLNESIPVHIVYFTVWVDEQGGVFFQPDIYGYDGKQSKPPLKAQPTH